MTTNQQITTYIFSHPQPKSSELETLHNLIIKLQPKAKLWFLDGKNSEGKVVSNPNIGYGLLTINYADGTNKEFYKVGLSANTTGISVYFMGIKDKTYLPNTYGKTLSKATVTGYCIKFKTLKDININELEDAIQFGFANE